LEGGDGFGIILEKEERVVSKEEVCECRTVLVNSNSFDVVILFFSNESTREDISTQNE